MSKKNKKKSNRGNEAAAKRMNAQLGISEEKVKVFGSGEEKTVTVFSDSPNEDVAAFEKYTPEEKEHEAVKAVEKPSPEIKKPEAAESEEDDSVTKEYIPEKKRKNNDEESFGEVVTEALGEDYEELGEEEIAEADEAVERERPNRFYLVFAIFVIVMSIIGIISTSLFFADGISDIVNQTGLKNDIALFLYPVVSVDPPECNEVKELPSTIIVESAIWRIILTGDNSNYEKQYNTYMYVPAVDVEYSIRAIYGSTAVIQHQTVGGADANFVYNADTNSYLVPMNPHYSAYSPRITEVSSVGELYTVTVDYIPPSALSIEGIEFENAPTKTMVYTLSMSRNATTIHSIKNATNLGGTYEY